MRRCLDARLGSENDLPILLHVHNDPAAHGGLPEGFDKLAGALRVGVISIFAFIIDMVHNQAETRARVVNRGVLQHGVIAITIPTTDDRSPADELMVLRSGVEGETDRKISA